MKLYLINYFTPTTEHLNDKNNHIKHRLNYLYYLISRLFKNVNDLFKCALKLLNYQMKRELKLLNYPPSSSLPPSLVHKIVRQKISTVPWSSSSSRPPSLIPCVITVTKSKWCRLDKNLPKSAVIMRHTNLLISNILLSFDMSFQLN